VLEEKSFATAGDRTPVVLSVTISTELPHLLAVEDREVKYRDQYKITVQFLNCTYCAVVSYAPKLGFPVMT
jgi:hypothetical protein